MSNGYSLDQQTGFVSPADDYLNDPLNIFNRLITNRDATFFFRASGHEMEGCGVFDGDTLVVDRSRPPGHGAVVVISADGEFLVRRCREVRGALQLHTVPADGDTRETMDPDACIWGVVTAVVRFL